jgi:hypothetical protein
LIFQESHSILAKILHRHLLVHEIGHPLFVLRGLLQLSLIEKCWQDIDAIHFQFHPQTDLFAPEMLLGWITFLHIPDICHPDLTVCCHLTDQVHEVFYFFLHVLFYFSSSLVKV